MPDFSEMSTEDLQARLKDLRGSADVSPEAQQAATSQLKLQQARQQAARDFPEEPSLGWWSRNISPSPGWLMSYVGGKAARRIQEGKPEEQDYQTLARAERFKGWQEEQHKTWGGALTGAALRAPEMALEFVAAKGALSGGAAALRGVGLLGEAAPAAAEVGVQVPRFLSAAGLRSAAAGAAKETLSLQGLGETAATTALVPSMYADRWLEGNVQQGRDPLDVRGLPSAYGLGLAQMSVLKGAGALTAPALPGRGLLPAAGRVGLQAASGPVAQAGADVGTSALDDVTSKVFGRSLGLQTGYGTIGELVRGDPEGALRNATVQAFTFAAFGLAHEVGGRRAPPRPGEPATPDPAGDILTKYQRAAEHLAKRGLPAEEAGRVLGQVGDIVSRLHEADPSPGHEQLQAEMASLPEGPLRDYGLAVADVFRGLKPGEQATAGGAPGTFAPTPAAAGQTPPARPVAGLLAGPRQPPQPAPPPAAPGAPPGPPAPPSGQAPTQAPAAPRPVPGPQAGPPAPGPQAPPVQAPPPPNPRQVVDTLDAQARDLRARLTEAQRVEARERTDSRAGMPNEDALAAAVKARQAISRDLGQAEKALAAARDRLMASGGPPAPDPRSGLINPTVPNEALGSLRTGAVEVPEKPVAPAEPIGSTEAKPAPEEVFSKADHERMAALEKTEVLSREQQKELTALATKFLQGHGVRSSRAPQPEMVPYAIDQSIAEAGLPKEQEQALRTILDLRSTRLAAKKLKDAGVEISHEGLRKRALQAIASLKEKDPDLWRDVNSPEDALQVRRRGGAPGAPVALTEKLAGVTAAKTPDPADEVQRALDDPQALEPVREEADVIKGIQARGRAIGLGPKRIQRDVEAALRAPHQEAAASRPAAGPAQPPQAAEAPGAPGEVERHADYLRQLRQHQAELQRLRELGPAAGPAGGLPVAPGPEGRAAGTAPGVAPPLPGGGPAAERPPGGQRGGVAVGPGPGEGPVPAAAPAQPDVVAKLRRSPEYERALRSVERDVREMQEQGTSPRRINQLLEDGIGESAVGESQEVADARELAHRDVLTRRTGRDYVKGGPPSAEPISSPTPARPTPLDQARDAALSRYAARQQQQGSAGGLFGGEDLQAREAFARLPDGERIVFTQGEFQGKVGKIVREADRIVATVLGRPGTVPVSPDSVEPLAPARSWRVGEVQAPVSQGGMFGAQHFLPKGPEHWEARAKEFGVEPAQLRQAVGELMREDSLTTLEANQVLRETRRMLGGVGKLLHLERFEDAASVPGLDEAAAYWKDRVPMYGDSDALFALLKRGNRSGLSRDQAHEQILAQMKEARDAEAAAGQAGFSAEAVAKSVRRAQEPGQAGDTPEAPGDAAEQGLVDRGPTEVAPGVSFFGGPGTRPAGERGGTVPVGGGRPGQPGVGEPIGSGPVGTHNFMGPAAELRQLIDDVKKFAAPAARGDTAQVGSGVLRENLAQMARRREVAQAALASGARYFDSHLAGVTPQERTSRFLSFTDAIEQGRIDTLPPDQRPIAQAIREQNDTRERMLLDRGLLESTIDNYLGHLWKKPGSNLTGEEIGRILGARRPLTGPEGYRKHRTLPTFRDGIEAGLEPADWNPVRLALMKMQEVDRSIMGRDTIQELTEQGLWVFRRLGQSPPEGFVQVKDKSGTVFAPPEVDIREYHDARQTAALEPFAASLGIPIRTEMRGPVGESSPAGIVRRFATPEEVTMHELGHQLTDRYRLNQWLQDPTIGKELEQLANLRASGRESQAMRASLTHPSERVPNLFAAYLHAPELLGQVAPTARAALESLISSRPELQPLRTIKPSLELGQRDQALRLAGPMLTGHYYTPEPIARILDNYLQPGLRGNRAYDAVRGFGNLLNMAQLGLSAFHAGFVSIDTQLSAAALGLQQISRGDFVRGAGSLIGAPLAPFRAWFKGSKVLSEYYAPGSQGAEVADTVDQLMKGGGRAKMDSFYHGNHIEAFRKALAEVRAGEAGKVPSLLYQALPALVEATNYPTMEVLVPRMKLGVFADLARFEMEKLPPGADANARRAALGRAWDSVDNRLGQVVYDNLHWSRTVKDVLMAGVRSVGWNLGTWREVGGGLKDIPESARGVASGQGITSRTAYLVALPLVTGFYGGLINYLYTGQGPQDLRDYWFPRTGRVRKDGTPDRISLPSYMKDLAALANRADEGPLRLGQNAWTMGSHKLHPAIGTVAEMFSNEDFYGTALRNPNDPAVKQSLDTMAHLVGAFRPFAFRGYDQARQTGATPGQAALNFVGVTPAPSYVTRSSEQQRRMETQRKWTPTPLEKKRREDMKR